MFSGLAAKVAVGVGWPSPGSTDAGKEKMVLKPSGTQPGCCHFFEKVAPQPWDLPCRICRVVFRSNLGAGARCRLVFGHKQWSGSQLATRSSKQHQQSQNHGYLVGRGKRNSCPGASYHTGVEAWKTKVIAHVTWRPRYEVFLSKKNQT